MQFDSYQKSARDGGVFGLGWGAAWRFSTSTFLRFFGEIWRDTRRDQGLSMYTVLSIRDDAVRVTT